jgi:hypothetical protein
MDLLEGEEEEKKEEITEGKQNPVENEETASKLTRMAEVLAKD